MCNSLAEIEELMQMRGNIRRSVQALELCWSCQRVSECLPSFVDDGAAVWLCGQCLNQVQSRWRKEPEALGQPHLPRHDRVNPI